MDHGPWSMYCLSAPNWPRCLICENGSGPFKYFPFGSCMLVSIISWEHWTGTVGTRVSFPVPVPHLRSFWRACFFLQCLAHIVFICERCLPGIDFSSIWPHVFFNSWLSSGSDSVSLSPVEITVFFPLNHMCAHAALSCPSLSCAWECPRFV